MGQLTAKTISFVLDFFDGRLPGLQGLLCH
jgi:hypothetical protein